MKNINHTSVCVISDYKAPYPDPISGRSGDRVAIDYNKKTSINGWLWCSNQLGKSGWIPENYLDKQGKIGFLRYDYDAKELTILVGEILTCHKEESGFIWVTNHAGESGWVPSTNVEIYSRKKKRISKIHN